MNTTVILISAAAVTLFSLLLKFINISWENTSIFRDIKKKNSEILQMISQLEVENEPGPKLKKFRFALSDWFSALVIALVSFNLIMEYASKEILTRATVVHVGLLFSLLLFNLIFLSISMIERRIGYWIDEFITVTGNIFEHIRINEKKEESKKSDNVIARSSQKKTKRVARLRKK